MAITLAERRVRADIVFPRRHVVVFMDGCFWHGCPQHGGVPTSNREYWTAKLARNFDRDRRVDSALQGSGWTVLRVWEHTEPRVAAREVIDLLESHSNMHPPAHLNSHDANRQPAPSPARGAIAPVPNTGALR